MFTDTANQIKVSCLSPFLRPAFAIVDPLFTVSCPPKVTADSGIDALTHAIEAFCAVDNDAFPLPSGEKSVYQGKNPMADVMASEAITLVGKFLRRAVKDGNDLEARDGMALAATLGGLAFSNAGVALVHAMEYPVGGAVHVSHGAGNGLLLPFVMRYNRTGGTDNAGGTSRVARCEATPLRAKNAEAIRAIGMVAKVREDIGIPTRLRDIGVKEEMLPGFAAKAFAIKRLMRVNPRMPQKRRRNPRHLSRRVLSCCMASNLAISPSPFRRIILAVGVVVVLLAGIVQLDQLFRGAMKAPLDFAAFWAAGHLAINGDNPYTRRPVRDTQAAVGLTDLAVIAWNPPWTLTLLMPIAQFHSAAPRTVVGEQFHAHGREYIYVMAYIRWCDALFVGRISHLAHLRSDCVSDRRGATHGSGTIWVGELRRGSSGGTTATSRCRHRTTRDQAPLVHSIGCMAPHRRKSEPLWSMRAAWCSSDGNTHVCSADPCRSERVGRLFRGCNRPAR